MFRDILANKWILGGGLLVIIACIAFFVLLEIDNARHKRRMMQMRNQIKATQQEGSLPEAEPTQDVSPMESTTSNEENPIIEPSDELETNTISDLVQDQQTGTQGEVVDASEVSVSPFGFGPYPEVPEGMLDPVGNPYKPVWKEPDYPNYEGDRDLELIDRVWIKAWEDGERNILGAGSDSDTSRIYLNYPNTIYVWYDEYETDEGEEIRYFTRVRGAGDVKLTTEQKLRGEVPPGVRVIDGETGGIDPYEYLGLNR